MAAYPTFAQIVGSNEEWLDDLVVDRAVGGGAKARSFFPAKKRRFILKHRLSETDFATFATFYNTNRALAVTLIWAGDGQTYTCLFEGPPKPQHGGTRQVAVEVRLAER